MCLKKHNPQSYQTVNSDSFKVQNKLATLSAETDDRSSDGGKKKQDITLTVYFFNICFSLAFNYKLQSQCI